MNDAIAQDREALALGRCARYRRDALYVTLVARDVSVDDGPPLIRYLDDADKLLRA